MKGKTDKTLPDRMPLLCRKLKIETSPQRCAARIVYELAILNADFTAICEICLPNKDSRKENNKGYILHWTGKTEQNWLLSDFGFIVKKQNKTKQKPHKANNCHSKNSMSL